jgi:hypothetical protein
VARPKPVHSNDPYESAGTSVRRASNRQGSDLFQLLLNRRFNPHANPASATKALAELDRCTAMFLEWKAAETAVRRDGRNLFIRRRSEQTQSGLERVRKLAQQLRHELKDTGAGHVFLRHSWADRQPTGVPWPNILDALAQLEEVSRALWEEGRNTKRGTPGLVMRRSMAVTVGAALDRLGYRVSKTANGIFAQVMTIILKEVGVRAPDDMRDLARDTAADLLALRKRPHSTPLSLVPRRPPRKWGGNSR